MPLVLAHISDLHVPARWPRAPWRWTPVQAGTAVHDLVLRSGAHPVEVLRALVQAVAAASPDHVVLTGDVGVLSLEAEFELARAELGPLADRPGFLTAIPGNHDHVTRAGARAFARTFADLATGDLDLGGGPYPFVRRRGGVAIVAVDSADGAVGPAQREALARALAHAEVASAPFRVLLCHHAPLGPAGGRDTYLRRMSDDRELLDVAGRGRVDLLLHGHVHEPYAHEVLREGHRFPVVGVGSSTLARGEPALRAGFNLYRIGVGHGGQSMEGARLVSLERHAWSEATGRFDRVAPIEVRPEPGLATASVEPPVKRV